MKSDNLPEQTKAAILTCQNRPLTVDLIDLPSDLEIGQILVEVIYSGICGSQIGEINGVKGDDKYLPHLLGHEGFAKVLAIGAGVTVAKPGDTVVLHWRKGIGIQSETPKYKWRDRTVNAGWVTTFNQFCVVSENRCTVVPADTDPRTAPLFGCAITTGFGAIVNDAKAKIGDSIVIFGAGGVGLNIIQAAKLTSCYPIIAVDLYQSRLKLAYQAGATHTIDSSIHDAFESIKEILNGDEVDIFIDNTGSPSIVEKGYEICGSHGKLILVGVPHYSSKISINTLALHFGRNILGSHGGDSNPSVDIRKYLKLVNQKLIDLSPLVTNEYGLDDINLAIEAMSSGSTAGRIIINFQ